MSRRYYVVVAGGSLVGWRGEYISCDTAGVWLRFPSDSGPFERWFPYNVTKESK